MARQQHIDVAVIEKIGQSLYGDHWWNASFARALDISKAYLSRILKGVDPDNYSDQPGRVPPEDFEISIQVIMLQRIADLTTLLDSPGMPAHGTEEIKEAGKLVQRAIQLVATGTQNRAAGASS